MIVQLDHPSATQTRRYDSVLCFGDSDWWYHNRGHADMQFMRRFARQTRVVYVNSLGVRTPAVAEGRMFLRKVRRKLSSMVRYYRDGGEGFGVLSPLYAPVSNRLISAAARRALLLQVQAVMTMCRMRRPLIWAVCPTSAVILPMLANQGIVHQLSDCYGSLAGSGPTSAEQYEREIAQGADLVLCSSQRLLERARQLYGKGEYIDHGVDVELFLRAGASSRQPPELAGIKPPIIGFYGNIDSNTVDRNLLEAVCRLRPGYSFVLVGDMTREFDSLRSIPNVTVLPRQPYQRIAEYGASFHVCLMPWLQNPWIEHCNPVKLKEYLALGKPVVSTPFPELERFESLCLTASGPEAFAMAIDRALHDDSSAEQQKRRTWASSHSWDSKHQLVLSRLRELGIQSDE